MANRIKKILIALVISFTCHSHPLFAQISDAQVKAAMIVRFTDFIYWPDESKQAQLDSELVIAILGDTPVSSILENNSFGTHHGKSFVRVQRINRISDIADPHILFISKGFHNDLNPFLTYARIHRLLTISEFDDLFDRKIMLNFYTEDNKVHFEIKPDIVKQNKFKISSRLMRIARVAASR